MNNKKIIKVKTTLRNELNKAQKKYYKGEVTVKADLDVIINKVIKKCSISKADMNMVLQDVAIKELVDKYESNLYTMLDTLIHNYAISKGFIQKHEVGKEADKVALTSIFGEEYLSNSEYREMTSDKHLMNTLTASVKNIISAELNNSAQFAVIHKEDIIDKVYSLGITAKDIRNYTPSKLSQLRDNVKANASRQKCQEFYIKNQSNYIAGYYTEKAGLFGTNEEKLDKLVQFYKERMKDSTEQVPTDKLLRETLIEYINLFSARGLDGFDVVADRIAMVSRKTSNDKHTLPYLIGCMRTNLENGMGCTNSTTDDNTISRWEKVFGIKLSPDGRAKMLEFITKYGSTVTLQTLVDVATSSPQLSTEMVYLDYFEQLITANI